jgi:TM2 domain-containing membrane protein YozV
MAQKRKNPFLAFVLGFLFSGLGLFYVLPPRKALAGFFATTILIVVSGGALWLPVALGIALYSARVASRGEELAFHGEPAPELSELSEAESLPHPRDSVG